MGFFFSLLVFVILGLLLYFLLRPYRMGTLEQDNLSTKFQDESIDLEQEFLQRYPELYRRNTSREQQRVDQQRTAQALYLIVASAIRDLRLERASLIANTQQRVTQSMFGYTEHLQSQDCAQSFLGTLNSTRDITRELEQATEFLVRMEVAGVCNLGVIATHIAVIVGIAGGKGDISEAQIQAALERVVAIALSFNCKINLVLDSLRAAAEFAGRTFDLAAIKARQIAQAYDKLGIAQDITPEEFRRVKRRKLAEFHPDKAREGQEQEYTIKFQQVNAWCELIESQW